MSVERKTAAAFAVMLPLMFTAAGIGYCFLAVNEGLLGFYPYLFSIASGLLKIAAFVFVWLKSRENRSFFGLIYTVTALAVLIAAYYAFPGDQYSLLNYSVRKLLFVGCVADCLLMIFHLGVEIVMFVKNNIPKD